MMTPEQRARKTIDTKLEQSGWIIQNMHELNITVGTGVAIREFPTSTGRVDYALFVDGKPIGIIEAKKNEGGENITAVEEQSSSYAHSLLKYVKINYHIRFVYEATGKMIRFTDYNDINYRSRTIFSFHRPETLQ